ncbi:hypothetical protein Q7O_000590 [Pectobacterium carotovorum subsp. carotovorum PCCS1]|nr:hypothetical protein [Pectobacterium carotovorum subsp. carotovorum PCCS1]
MSIQRPTMAKKLWLVAKEKFILFQHQFMNVMFLLMVNMLRISS